MPVQAKADNNVPWIGPRSRYNVLCASPVWNYQRMNNGSGFTTDPPEALGVGPNLLDPTVSSGRVEWTNLIKGGLFTALYKTGRPFIVEAVDLKAGVALTIVDPANPATVLRAFPTTFPALIAAGELIKATGADTTAYAGLLVRTKEDRGS